MNTIKKIGLENIRVFKDYHEIDLNYITILTGPNNSGKSTIQKVLTVLKGSFASKDNLANIEEIRFDPTSLAGIPNINSFKNFDSSDDAPIKIEVTFDAPLFGEIKASLNYTPQSSKEHFVLDKIIFKSLQDVVLLEYEKDQFWSLKEVSSGEILDVMLTTKNQGYIDFFLNEMIEDHKKLGIDERSKAELEDLGFSIDFEKIQCIDMNSMLTDIDSPFTYKGEKYEYRDGLKKSYEFWGCPIKEVLIYSELANKVINGNLFTSTELDLTQIQIKEILIAQDVFSVEEFIQWYNKELVLPIIEIIFTKGNAFYQSERNNASNFYEETGYFVSFDRDLKSYSRLDTDHGYTSELLMNDINSALEGGDALLAFLESNGELDLQENQKISQITNAVERLNNGKKFRTVIEDSIGKTHHHFLSLLEAFQNTLKGVEEYKTHLKRYYFHEDKGNLLYDFAHRGGGDLLTVINDWLSRLSIADKLIIKPIHIEGEPLGYAFYIHKMGHDVPLLDNGLGITRLISTLMKLRKGGFIILEEPEANMHPKLQSYIADILVEAVEKYNCRILVETHSEYLIRKLQYLVAKKRIKPTEVSIFYMHDPLDIPKDTHQIFKLDIREDGMIKQDFGVGFFDEAMRTTYELLKLQNRN